MGSEKVAFQSSPGGYTSDRDPPHALAQKDSSHTEAIISEQANQISEIFAYFQTIFLRAMHCSTYKSRMALLRCSEMNIMLGPEHS